MGKATSFQDFDDQTIYNDSLKRAQLYATHNFVIEFGKDKAQIGLDLNGQDVRRLLENKDRAETQVRWINIWGPNRQVEIIELLGKHYKFTGRLLAIIQTLPLETASESIDRHVGKAKSKFSLKDDIERAPSSIEISRADSPPGLASPKTSHYTIAQQMISYQSVDFGTHYMCIGANWMHEVSNLISDDNIAAEGKPQRLWSWLVLCDDNTVISLHEDTGRVDDVDVLKSMRRNTLSVLSQLSKCGHGNADPISMTTVRQALELESSLSDPGKEGASNLFYYLFDDWRGVYSTISSYQHRLETLQTQILGDISRKSNSTPDILIIPRLHTLGRQIRQMQHLYDGYKNLITRIIEPGSADLQGYVTPRSFSGLTASVKGVNVTQSARLRFERLGDRLQLLILSEIQEFLDEKDALISTYFNINAQKDSEATARLTRSATLLAKLSVLFLPVSLMTSYFSVQISDLQGVYTSKDYWYTFAVIMSISFMFLFFFSRLLMWITETLDGMVKNAIKRILRKKSKDRA